MLSYIGIKEITRVDKMTANKDNRITIFGIKNCNTMKKAFTYLDEHQFDYQFHDYKKQGIDKEHLQAWCKAHGWEKVINRAGLTFKKLTDEQKTDLTESKAIELMIAQPSMIKRPVLALGNKTLLGFKVDEYDQLLVSK